MYANIFLNQSLPTRHHTPRGRGQLLRGPRPLILSPRAALVDGRFRRRRFELAHRVTMVCRFQVSSFYCGRTVGRSPLSLSLSYRSQCSRGSGLRCRPSLRLWTSRSSTFRARLSLTHRARYSDGAATTLPQRRGRAHKCSSSMAAEGTYSGTAGTSSPRRARWLILVLMLSGALPCTHGASAST